MLRETMMFRRRLAFIEGEMIAEEPSVRIDRSHGDEFEDCLEIFPSLWEGLGEGLSGISISLS